jgi:osmotically-inducible protein OsmY
MKNRILTTAIVGALALFGAAAWADRSSDAAVTWKTKLHLLEKLGVEALEIDVDTVNGAVHLTGEVEKRATVELASTVVQSVEGVQSVDNDLVLEQPSGNTVARAAGELEKEVKDAMLESRVRLALFEAIGASAVEIGTEAADGTVVLEFGMEVSKPARDRAVASVRALEGVRKVSAVDKRG